MGLLTTVFILIFFISFVVFILFFGRIPALRYSFVKFYIYWGKAYFERNTPIGALNRLLRVLLPRRLLTLDQRLTNGRLHASIARFLRYLTHERHPTVLVRLPLSLNCQLVRLCV
jgi:palmitoyltransferase ZDHHC4